MDYIVPGSFGEVLQLYRKRKRLTQKRLATLLGIHYNTVCGWEQGNHLPESKSTILELANLLHLNEQETRHLLESSLTGLSPHWSVPYQRNPFFTGRESILEQLHHVLCEQNKAGQARAYALKGLGGIGKTQTALEYCYRYYQEYTAVFWINAETLESLTANLLAIAEHLFSPKVPQEQSKLLQAVITWLNTHKGWLVIVDNLEDLSLVKPYLPAARHGALLFTTRLHDLGTLAHSLEIEPMSPEEGATFLLRRIDLQNESGAQDSSIAYQDARRLVQAMGGLPLALEQARAYIEATHCSLSDYLSLFQEYPMSLLQEQNVYTAHPLSVVKTFTHSFERLQQQYPAAAELLTLCCFLAPEEIPEEVIYKGSSHLGPLLRETVIHPLLFNITIKQLLAYSLIRRQTKTRTLSVHRLVQSILQANMGEKLQKIWVQRAILMLDEAFPQDYTSLTKWRLCVSLSPHIFHVLTLSQQWEARSADHEPLFSKMTRYLITRGSYQEAEALYQHVLGTEEQAQRLAHPDLAPTLVSLADVKRKQGKYNEAEQYYQQALSILHQAVQPNQRHVALLLEGRALLLSELGQYEEAERLQQQVMQLREHVLDSHHPEVARAFYFLATIYSQQGRFQEAEELFLRARGIREQICGTEHPAVAVIQSNLATIYSQQGRFQEAEELFLRARHVFPKFQIFTHPQLAYLLNNLALLYSQQDRFQEAEVLFLQASSMYEENLGSEHPEVASPLCGLATMYYRQSRFEEAEHLARQALQIWEESFTSDHPRLAVPLITLAQIASTRGREKEAEFLLQRAIHVQEQRTRFQHPELLKAQKHLAELRMKQERYEDAEALFHRILILCITRSESEAS